MINKLKFKFKIIKGIIKEADPEMMKKNPSKIEKLKFILKRYTKYNRKLLNVIFKKRFEISYVEIVLTTVCTLNCKGCSALMEYYKERENTDLEKNIKTLKNLLECCDSINHLRLLGGEPLCYPYLYEILEFINSQEKIKRATIVTNGTLLITDNRITDILKNDKFYIFISNYGKISNKKDELINFLNKNNINYILRDTDFLWRDYGDLNCRNRSERELKRQYIACKIMCSSIYNGILHHCPRCTHGTNLGKIPLKETDYINLLDDSISVKEKRERLFKFFYGYTPYIEACNYCNSGTKDMKSILAGQQCKPTGK